MDEIMLRQIQPGDNAVIAAIIRNALAEFKANKPGTVFYDDTTDHLFELFQGTRGVYNVALLNGQVVGGGGIFPTPCMRNLALHTSVAHWGTAAIMAAMCG